ncbi:hypothetical protein WJX84_011502 [Apatococcus fuscideae]|uniref:Uncharacterized protein n=1 Tax=Apatococcus fuscideae TaxID=2026836 RepID=A0AAW1RVG1_9CHLO
MAMVNAVGPSTLLENNQGASLYGKARSHDQLLAVHDLSIDGSCLPCMAGGWSYCSTSPHSDSFDMHTQA